MKTNHQRGYKDTGSFRQDRGGMTSRVTGKSAVIGHDFTDGHRGQARATHGAKKYINSRDRVAHKRATLKASQEEASG